MRMPISRVRSRVVNQSTPASPTAASSSAEIPKVPSSVVVNRGRASSADIIAPTVATSSSRTLGSSAVASRRSAGTSAAGSAAVRMTRWLRGQGLCSKGTYTSRLTLSSPR